MLKTAGLEELRCSLNVDMIGIFFLAAHLLKWLYFVIRFQVKFQLLITTRYSFLNLGA